VSSLSPQSSSSLGWFSDSVRIEQQVTQAQKVILNLASREIAFALCTTPIDELRSLIASGKSLDTVLPDDFADQVLHRVPGVLRGTTKTVLQSMGDACWDLLLVYLDRIAVQAKATGDPGQIQSAGHLQRAIAVVGNTRALPWYRDSMRKVRDRIVSLLAGDDKK